MAAVSLDFRGPWGYINPTGAFVVEPKFLCAFPFNEALAAVVGSEGVGYIDKTGKFAISTSFTFGGPFRGGLAEVYSGGKFSFVDRLGHVAIKEPSDITLPPVGLEAICGLSILDQLPNPIVRTFGDGRAPILKKGKWGYIDSTGKVVITPHFEEARMFFEGLAAVRVGDKWGFVDTTGKMVIPAVFTSAGDFHEGMAVITR